MYTTNCHRNVLLAAGVAVAVIVNDVSQMIEERRLVRQMAGANLARDRTIVVVEHDMAFVRSLGAKVTVLHEGSVLAEGTLEQVQNDERVIEGYLGR